MPTPLRLDWLRPQVRYVDDERAVIDTHFAALPPVAEDAYEAVPDRYALDVEITVDGQDGFHDEGASRLTLDGHRGHLRFEIVRPDRWFPAGYGPQPLYKLGLTVGDDARGFDHLDVDFGCTSIRRDRALGRDLPPCLLVNGRICSVAEVVEVDAAHAAALLPAHGESVVFVTDHYGDDTLYAAADRAGILIVQSVPLTPDGRPASAAAEAINRLSAHPSLAGWYVGHLGDAADDVTAALEKHDGTHPVFRRFPLDDAAEVGQAFPPDTKPREPDEFTSPPRW